MDRTQLLVLALTVITTISKSLQDTNKLSPVSLSKPWRLLVVAGLGIVGAGVDALVNGGDFGTAAMTAATLAAPGIVLLLVELANTKAVLADATIVGGDVARISKRPPAQAGFATPAIMVAVSCAAVLAVAACFWTGCSGAQKQTEMDIAKQADDIFTRVCGNDAPIETCTRYVQQLTDMLGAKRLAASRGDAGAK